MRFSTLLPRPILPLLCCFLLGAGLEAQTAADWSIGSRETLPAPARAGLQTALVKLEAARPELPPVTAHVVLFEPAEFTFKVVDDPAEKLGNLRQAMEQVNAVAGVNGGYFHPDRSPLGLVVSGGQLVHPQE